MQLNYKKIRAHRIGNVEVEQWHAFREIDKIVYRDGASEMEFPAERLGWQLFRPNWLGVQLPAALLEEGRTGERVESIAAQIHLALCVMKVPNVVSVQAPAADTSPADREKILNEFAEWMRHHGWNVTVDKLSTLGRKLRIKRRALAFSRPRLTAEEILAQGRWVARAFEALLTSERKEQCIYISERARHATFVVSIEW